MSESASPLNMLGVMPALPANWRTMPVQQDLQRPLEPGFRWPLTAYRQIEIADINEALASS